MDAGELITKLWLEYEAYIRKFCTYKLSSMPRYIDDCVQDVFLSLSIAVKNKKEIKNPKAWLTAVANNKVNDIYKEAKKNADNIVPLTDYLAQTIVDPSPDISDEPKVSQERIAETKEEFLKSLSQEEYSLFEERFVLKKSCKEIALLKGTTESNIRKRIFRLRQKAKEFAKDCLFD